jgi:epoxyqueuosine reductase
MIETLIPELEKFVHESGIPLVAVADTDVLNASAPEGFRPQDYLPEAKSMIILAKPLPLSVFMVPNDRTYKSYIRAYHTYYHLMNEVSHNLATRMEQEGFRSLPIPAYSPVKFHQGELWGLMSLKHAAVAAGLGTMGKNMLFIHPKEGNILRFGGVLTTMPWPAGKDKTEEYKKLCPESCTLCIEACPVKALRDGGIDKTVCMTKCVSHVMMPPRFIMLLLRHLMRHSKGLSRFMELMTLNLFENYGIRCMECLVACPRFPGHRKT